ncbi:MAG: 30S ribosomal protein S6 [bacterium]
MQKNYELLYIVHPDLEGSIDKVSEKVASFVAKADGKITSQDDWGKRKLAYKIAKNDFGIYSLVYFSAESEKLSNLERELMLSEEIIRSMVVAIPVISPVKAAKKAAKKPRVKPEDRVDAPSSIIVNAEKPKKATIEKAVEKEVKEVKGTITKEDKPAKKAAVKKTAKTEEKEEKARLKKLDEKLDELLK